MVTSYTPTFDLALVFLIAECQRKKCEHRNGL